MTKKELETALVAMQAQLAATAGAVAIAKADPAIKGKAPKGLSADGKPVWEQFHTIKISPSLEVRASYKLGMGGSVQTVRTDAAGRSVFYSFGRSITKFAELAALGVPAPLISALTEAARYGETVLGDKWGNK